MKESEIPEYAADLVRRIKTEDPNRTCPEGFSEGYGEKATCAVEHRAENSKRPELDLVEEKISHVSKSIYQLTVKQREEGPHTLEKGDEQYYDEATCTECVRQYESPEMSGLIRLFSDQIFFCSSRRAKFEWKKSDAFWDYADYHQPIKAIYVIISMLRGHTDGYP
ncbi:hypothetical protein K432DRAFT_192726 [Lepidopterella palustris CBS 459.81]|uniref:Uncharacterized protein n=1 Tax=Lepidopterella palustris CBS 459.81 TaxID=1314670 RepID=A0A8E2JI57_9PEZI|nr:hypothetical protein K432DRAFT_192726 [Lepidopterella palustris CBS 459.81]